MLDKKMKKNTQNDLRETEKLISKRIEEEIHNLLKISLFLHCTALKGHHPTSNDYVFMFVSGVSTLFHCSVCLSLHQHTVLYYGDFK